MSERAIHVLAFFILLHVVAGQVITRPCLEEISCHRTKYQPHDGSCNNPMDPHAGKAGIALKRYLPSAYDGGEGVPRGKDSMPSARAISLAIRDEEKPNSTEVSNFFPTWGQFLAHDIARTQANEDANLTCPCNNVTSDECFNIPVEVGDPMRDQGGVECIEFMRSAPAYDGMCQLVPRTPVNLETSYIDASMVYGSTDSLASALRSETVPGELKVMNMTRPNSESLPLESQVESDVPMDCPAIHRPIDTPCFAAGDARINEQPPLSVSHLTFLRLHNKIVRYVTEENPLWGGEKLYQTVRKIVAAVTQQITYNEFLPKVIGPKYMERFRLGLTKSDYLYGYRPHYDATIEVSFTTAALRFGHTLVQGDQTMRDAHHVTTQVLELEDNFFSTEPIMMQDGVRQIVRGLSSDPASQFDPQFISALTDQLFKDRNDSFGSDLMALNIQRGRDHGIASYYEHRRLCGLPLDGSDIDAEKWTKLLEAYNGNADDIDLYPAGVSETSVEGGIVGNTFACLLAMQFRDLKYGDIRWFENREHPDPFTPEQLAVIKDITLADVVCSANDLTAIQPRVMEVVSVSNPIRDCECGKFKKLAKLFVKSCFDEEHFPSIADAEWSTWIPIAEYNDVDPPQEPLPALLAIALERRPEDVCRKATELEMRRVNGNFQARFLCPPGLIEGTDYPVSDAAHNYWGDWTNQNTPTPPSLDDVEPFDTSGACSGPVAIQAQTVDGVPARETGDVFEKLSAEEGLVCLGEHQPSNSCYDYRVRYLCPYD